MSLFKDLKRFTKKEKISMHIPGHKGGRGIGASFAKNAFKLDLTEVDGTDNLQNPTGILKSAQDNCAKIFGAAKTYFLTGGSSLGLRASILGCLKRGDKLIVDRLCHKAVISAVTLGGVEPIFITPEFDSQSGLYTGISAERLDCVLAENPDAKGVIITSPNYYGICSDIGAIAKILHRLGKFLIVDEAHGAHFTFCKELPETALSQGADICIQSAHKTLTSLGQSSFLHVRGDIVNRTRLERTLRMIQSTSPSYLLMASLDETARYMNRQGRIKLWSLVYKIRDLKTEVTEKTVLKFADSTSLGRVCDDTRIVVDFSPLEVSGYFAQSFLIDNYGIYPELADDRYVVFIPTVSNTAGEIKRLRDALFDIGGRRFAGQKASNNIPLPNIRLAYPPYMANDMETETVATDKSVGRVSGTVVSACPPGCAVLVAGQYIDQDAAEYIIKNKVADLIEVIKE